MSTSLDDFRSRPRSAQPQDKIASLRALAQEPPRMQALTGSEHWDYFARYIEAQIRMTEAECEAARRRVAGLLMVDEPAARKLAVEVTKLEVRADTLRAVIILPKWLMDQGVKAAEMVAEFEKSA